MKKQFTLMIIFVGMLFAACQGDGNINDTIEEDSVEAIRLPDDNTDVDKLVDTSPDVNRYDTTIHKNRDTIE